MRNTAWRFTAFVLEEIRKMILHWQQFGFHGIDCDAVYGDNGGTSLKAVFHCGGIAVLAQLPFAPEAVQEILE